MDAPTFRMRHTSSVGHRLDGTHRRGAHGNHPAAGITGSVEDGTTRSIVPRRDRYERHHGHQGHQQVRTHDTLGCHAAGTWRSGIGRAANSRRHGRAINRAMRTERVVRAESVAMPVFAYICR